MFIALSPDSVVINNTAGARTTLFTALCLFSWLAVIPPPALAAGAVNKNNAVQTRFDRQSTPAYLVVWQNEKGGTDPNPAIRGRDSWVCHSRTDTSRGACPTSPVWSDSKPRTPIRLAFTEKRSKVTVNLTLNGGIASYNDPVNACTLWGSSRGMHNPITVHCQGGKSYNGVALMVILPGSELKKIPSGGIWEAQLVLRQRQWSPGKDVASWTTHFTLDVTDRNNGAIYLPAFHKADALVDLNLRTRPLSTAPGGEVSGSTVIDTCLYDGYNANNPWLQVTLADLLPGSGRGGDIFSVTKTGTAGAAATDRIDYRITMDYNGNPVAMGNNKTMILRGVNTALIRPVALPGFPVPVVCTPTPLTLNVVPFTKASKTAGRYTGKLRIKLAAGTLAP